jgi:hypothetical protein
MTMWRVDKWHLGPGPEGAGPKETDTRGRQCNNRQPNQPWSRHAPRQPVALREAKPQDRQSPSRMRNPGTSTETSKTSVRKGTRESPMQTHETSPVLGASVMGMTSGVCQGQRCPPAGVPGISTVLGKEDRL